MKPTKLNPTPAEFLRDKSACADGIAFAMKHETMADVWKHCPRADWMLWICREMKLDLDQKALRLFACYCVRKTPVGHGKTVWDLLKDERSREAVRVAERFANGKETDKERRAAYAAAYAAAAAAAAAAADAYAAAYAAAAAAADAYAAAYDAADAAADAAAYAADDAAARRTAHAFQAKRLRKVITNPFLAVKP